MSDTSKTVRTRKDFEKAVREVLLLGSIAFAFTAKAHKAKGQIKPWIANAKRISKLQAIHRGNA